MNRPITISLLLCFFFGSLMAQVEQTIPLQGEKEITVVTQIGGQNEIELYPNPTLDFLIVEIKNSEMKNVEFEIRSLLGNEMIVNPEQVGFDRYRFQVKDFNTGYYFIIVKDEETRFKKAFRFLKSN